MKNHDKYASYIDLMREVLKEAVDETTANSIVSFDMSNERVLEILCNIEFGMSLEQGFKLTLALLTRTPVISVNDAKPFHAFVSGGWPLMTAPAEPDLILALNNSNTNQT
jgi:hypothetical protein